MQQNAQECVWEKTPPLSGKNPTNPNVYDLYLLRSPPWPPLRMYVLTIETESERGGLRGG